MIVSMKIIATHVNADFDGFAAMVGLTKLHPDAKLVFPGSREPGLRQFFRETAMEVPEVPAKDVQSVTHLILVDVARGERLGALEGLLSLSPRPLIEVYDHHPEDQGNIRADYAHIHPYGSTTTIVVLQLMNTLGDLPALTTLEASVLLAGIYEDTANFLSAGTTPEDLRAALWLLEQGAEINIVNRILTHRLNPDQTAFFNTMVASCERLTLEGRSVVLSAFSWPSFVPEAAYLVHRLMDLEPIDIFFALVLMDNRVHIIARSAVPDVDAGQILTHLNGGGHKNAASAVLKGMTVIEAREKLLGVLQQNLKRRETARDLMKGNVITIAAHQKISEAAQQMNTYRINALTVTVGEKVVGTISRQIVDGAIFHGLQDQTVESYMSADLPLIDPDTPAQEILNRMFSGHPRFVLVGKDPEHVEGIITRMDLFRFQYELSSQGLPLRKGKQSENLKAMLQKRLPESVMQLLQHAGSVAENSGCKIYLVGGMVRDLLLHRENIDLDLVVEGDGIKFAEEFGREQGCQVSTHPRFGTARLLFPDGFKMDVATARTESYHAPAALPQVLGGVLRQDLYRRDFTINTMAIDLMPKHFGRLLDYFGGWDDLHHGVIRVLHSLSFVDDPTRTLRAIRFATRFNFQISKDTERLMESAVQARVMEKLSGKRLWGEFRNILLEEHPIPSIRLIHHYRLLPFIHPLITLDSFLLDLLYQVQSVLSWFHLNFLKERPLSWLLYLMALMEKLDRPERMAVSQRFQLTTSVQEMLRHYKSNTRDIRLRLLNRPDLKPGVLYFSLREFPLEVLLYAMARSSEDSIRTQIARYLRDLRGVKLSIKGDDLIKLGIPKGPQIREVLDEVLKAKLDGIADSREEQLQFVERMGITTKAQRH